MTDQTFQFRTMPASMSRAFMGFAALIAMGIGLGMLWGTGAALFGVGLAVWIDCSLDEVEERFTGVKRS